MENLEIEVKFLEVDKEALKNKLKNLGALDCGESFLEEIIFYDKDLTWIGGRKFIRIRKDNAGAVLTYKHHNIPPEAKEIEFGIGDAEKTALFLEELGFVPYRRQQKFRHKFKLGNVIFDIDTWPRIPVYVEVEGPSLEEIKNAAVQIGFDWNKAVWQDAKWVIENIYSIPVGKMRWFTFARFEE